MGFSAPVVARGNCQGRVTSSGRHATAAQCSSAAVCAQPHPASFHACFSTQVILQARNNTLPPTIQVGLLTVEASLLCLYTC